MIVFNTFVRLQVYSLCISVHCVCLLCDRLAVSHPVQAGVSSSLPVTWQKNDLMQIKDE